MNPVKQVKATVDEEQVWDPQLQPTQELPVNPYPALHVRATVAEVQVAAPAPHKLQVLLDK